MKLIEKVISVFKREPKVVPENHKVCPRCDGTGEFEVLIDCLVCDGHGYISNKEYFKMLYENKHEDTI